MANLGVTIHKNSDGTVTVRTDKNKVVIDTKSMTFQKRAEAVREAILAQGLYFSRKIEKMMLKELGR